MRILFLFLLFLAVFTQTSCKRCYQCTTETTITTNLVGLSNTISNSSTTEVCDRKKEIEAYEKENTSSVSTGIIGNSITTDIETKCLRD